MIRSRRYRLQMPLTPITPSVGIPTYVDGGLANAIQITIAGLVTYLDDAIYNVIIAHANTGNTTFQVNGLAQLPLLTATGDQLTAGQLQPGMIATIETVGGNSYLLNPFASSIQFTMFTANGNFVPLVSGNYLITASGGGGGGGFGGNVAAAPASVALGGTGGQNGELRQTLIALAAGTVYPVVIGTGGAKGKALGFVQPTAGNPTTFNGVTVANGGAPGVGARQAFALLTGDNSGPGQTGYGAAGGVGGASVGTQNPGANAGAAGVNSGSGGGGGSGASNGAGTTANLGGDGSDGAAGWLTIQKV